jgi:hypothetical protein
MKRITALRLLNVFFTVSFSFGLTAFITIAYVMTTVGYSPLFVIFSWSFGLVAWTLLVLMGVAWAFEKKLHKAIPITGTVIGTLSVLPWIPIILPIVTLVPALFLAVRLVSFHLNDQHDNATLQQTQP